MPPAKKPMAKTPMRPKSKFATPGSKEEKRRVEAIRKTRASAGKSGLMNSAVVSQPKKAKSTRPVITGVNAPKIKRDRIQPYEEWRDSPQGQEVAKLPAEVDKFNAYLYLTNQVVDKKYNKQKAAQNKKIMRVQKLITAKPNKATAKRAVKAVKK